MSARREYKNKEYVEVIGLFREDGVFIPYRFRTSEGQVIRIDRMLDRRRAASLKAGGAGIRYTCRIEGRELYLFEDYDQEDDRTWWFIEKDSFQALQS